MSVSFEINQLNLKVQKPTPVTQTQAVTDSLVRGLQHLISEREAGGSHDHGYSTESNASASSNAVRYIIEELSIDLRGDLSGVEEVGNIAARAIMQKLDILTGGER